MQLSGSGFGSNDPRFIKRVLSSYHTEYITYVNWNQKLIQKGRVSNYKLIEGEELHYDFRCHVESNDERELNEKTQDEIEEGKEEIELEEFESTKSNSINPKDPNTKKEASFVKYIYRDMSGVEELWLSDPNPNLEKTITIRFQSHGESNPESNPESNETLKLQFEIINKKIRNFYFI